LPINVLFLNCQVASKKIEYNNLLPKGIVGRKTVKTIKAIAVETKKYKK
jgi:hypothetical protein